MVRHECDFCHRLKAPDETWILGFAVENIGVTAARREIVIASAWDPKRGNCLGLNRRGSRSSKKESWFRKSAWSEYFQARRLKPGSRGLPRHQNPRKRERRAPDSQDEGVTAMAVALCRVPGFCQCAWLACFFGKLVRRAVLDSISQG